MKKTLFIIALSSILLSSCTKQEYIYVEYSLGRIKTKVLEKPKWANSHNEDSIMWNLAFDEYSNSLVAKEMVKATFKEKGIDYEIKDIYDFNLIKINNKRKFKKDVERMLNDELDVNDFLYLHRDDANFINRKKKNIDYALSEVEQVEKEYPIVAIKLLEYLQ